MMKAMRTFAGMLALATVAGATSVRPGLHECPVCGTDSVTMRLASYSQFGEPARDLSDSPMFRFSRVDICPADLFASWRSRWETVGPDEKERLAEFLKDPVVALTEEERRIVGGNLEDLKSSSLWKLLWVRTCDGVREPAPRREWLSSMELFFASKSAGEGWRREQADHWRDEAIRRLGEATAEDWPDEEERWVFPYLRAELLRQAGRDSEAKVVFAAVVANEADQAEDPKKEWLGRWAREQSWRIDAKEMDAAGLADWLMEEMPDPWREKDKLSGDDWGRHVVALEALVERALGGNEAAAEVLWRALREDVRRLLALGETQRGQSFSKLREMDAKWDAWLEEIAEGVRTEALPGFEDERNMTRVTNVLGRMVGHYRGSFPHDPDGGPDLPALLAAAEKAVEAGEEGGALQTELSPDAAARGLDRLWDLHPEKRDMLAKVRVRLLKETGEKPEEIDHRVPWDFLDLVEVPEEVLRGELEGEWKSGFWRSAVEYLAGDQAAARRLAAHPLAEAEFAERGRLVGEMLWRLFRKREDPVWRTRLLEELAGEERVGTEVLFYAAVFPEDEEVDAALDARWTRFQEMAGAGDDNRTEMRLWERKEIEETLVLRRLGRLPAE